jgi:hypothetical protein
MPKPSGPAGGTGCSSCPGLELTVDDPDPRRAGHALAIGLREFVSVDRGLERALRSARETGAALIAAHPYPLAQAAASMRGTAWFSEEPDWGRGSGRPVRALQPGRSLRLDRPTAAAVGRDRRLHRPEHLFSWKTLLDCERTEASVVSALRSGRQFPLMRIGASRVAA